MSVRLGVQVRRFLAVGVTAVVVDSATYSLCLAGGLPINLAKASGFLLGTAFAYMANRFWTFEAAARRGALRDFLLLYLATLAVNVAVNAAMIAWLGKTRPALAAAFVVATAVSATLNFLGLKLHVFRV
jgi:polyisoprenyl-phosphate glycosyltransferase